MISSSLQRKKAFDSPITAAVSLCDSDELVRFMPLSSYQKLKQVWHFLTRKSVVHGWVRFFLLDVLIILLNSCLNNEGNEDLCSWSQKINTKTQTRHCVMDAAQTYVFETLAVQLLLYNSENTVAPTMLEIKATSKLPVTLIVRNYSSAKWKRAFYCLSAITILENSQIQTKKLYNFVFSNFLFSVYYLVFHFVIS